MRRRSSLHRSLLILGLAVGLIWVSRPTSADDPKGPREGASNKSNNATEKPKGSVSRAEREKQALAFVRKHHPELAELLEPLKAMRPEEYNRAIAELFQVSRSLDEIKKNNPRHYEAGLELWKAKSKAELLGAKLISSPSPELESQLREALAVQFDLEIRKQELLEEQLRARLNQIEKNVKRLKADREARIESRMQELQKKVRRARRQEDGGKSAPAPAARAKRESKA